MDEAIVFCHICGGLITPWDDRAEWNGRLAHAECVAAQEEELDPEWMEDMGYEQ